MCKRQGMQERRHQTEQDAHELYVEASMGHCVGASDMFLVALRARLYRWIASIDAELSSRAEAKARQDFLDGERGAS